MSDLQLESDSELHTAFREIFEATFEDLTRFVARRVDSHLRDDVVSETFLVAWRRFDEMPQEVARIRPWLFAIARRILANTYRGRDRAASLVQRIAAQPTASSEDPANTAIRVDYARAFDRLSDRDQEVLKLVAWDGLSAAESAQVLEISSAAFSARLSRARKRLRKHLENPINPKDQS